MKIDIYSDLHLSHWYGFDPETSFPKQNADHCIVAGDIANGQYEGQKFFDFLKQRYKKIFKVWGNHDWYLFGFPKDDQFIDDFDGLKIVGCTLWTDFRKNPDASLLASSAISDFRLIPGMTTAGMVELNRQDREFLLKNDDADIVVTHFPPLIQSEHEHYKDSPLNPYFVNDDPELVLSMGNCRLWVHGHTHKPFDYKFNGVRVVCNPTGYPGESQYVPVFLPKTVEI